MSTVAIYLNGHCRPGEIGTFRAVCERVAAVEEDTTIVGLHTGGALVELAADFDNVEHLVIAAHGGPTWILDDQYGITTGDATHPDQCTVGDFVETWSWSMTQYSKISLAACLCSRSPSWFLRRRWGNIGSDWGKRAYLPGGQASLSGRIRDGMRWCGVYADVIGHRSAGHADGNPIGAVHKGTQEAGSPCISWWQLENPGKEPTLLARRRWVREMRGAPARSLLMGW